MRRAKWLHVSNLHVDESGKKKVMQEPSANHEGGFSTRNVEPPASPVPDPNKA